MTNERLADYKLVEAGTQVHFDVISTDIQRPEHLDEVVVRIELQLGEEEEDGDRSEDWEWGSFGFIFVLALLSFADARPRGISELEVEPDDQFNVVDLFDHLRFERGRLTFTADYIRGRCVKTDIEVGATGRVILDTRNRGEAALRWLDRLKGKKPLALA